MIGRRPDLSRGARGGVSTSHENLVPTQAGELFQALDETPEDEAANDEEGDADDEKAPAGDACNVLIIKLFPVLGMGVEVGEEVVGEAEVHEGGEAEGAEKEESGGPEELHVGEVLLVFGHSLGDTLVIEEGVGIDEEVEKRAFRAVGDEEKGAENEWLDRFFQPEKEGGVRPRSGVGGGEEVDRDGSGEEDVEEANGGENIEFPVRDEVPDAIGDGDGEGEGHGLVGAEVVNGVAFLAAVAEDENGGEDVENDVGERVVLLVLRRRGDGVGALGHDAIVAKRRAEVNLDSLDVGDDLVNF